MRTTASLLTIVLFGCATESAAPVTVDPAEAGGKQDGQSAVPDVRCSGAPDVGPSESFRHFSSDVIAALGDPRHRGFDLVAPASSDVQALEGWISYTLADKALEDEDVDVFACRAQQWHYVGRTTTDDEGHFSLALSGDERVPIGMRDLYVSVVGDRTGVGYLGFVAPDGSPLIVSDVDGTLTLSENVFLETILLGLEPDEQPGSSAAYQLARTKGFPLVYVTARGNQYTEDTRKWLANKRFPRGPVRLSPSFFTLPGSDTVDYKTATITALGAGLELAAGVGNRASDITAYTAANLPAQRIFLKLPEYESELADALDAHSAIGFSSYDELRTRHLAGM